MLGRRIVRLIDRLYYWLTDRRARRFKLGCTYAVSGRYSPRYGGLVVRLLTYDKRNHWFVAEVARGNKHFGSDFRVFPLPWELVHAQ